MIRKLALFAPFAVLALSACDGPSALTKAQPGECYAVVGREANGEPKWQRTSCAASALPTTAVAALPPAQAVTPPAALSTPACPTSAPVSCPPAAAATARVTRTTARGAERRAGKVTTRSREGRVEARTYARVPQDDYLLGGPEVSRGDHYSYRGDPYSPPMPPLPPADRYLGHGYGEREYERYRGDDLAPPPHRHDRRGESADNGHHRYSERREYRSAPPYRGDEYGSREERYSYRNEESSSSSSYSSRSSSSHRGRGRGPCCEAGRGAMAPMNGPHFPVDQDGFLTWRGKTPE